MYVLQGKYTMVDTGSVGGRIKLRFGVGYETFVC